MLREKLGPLRTVGKLGGVVARPQLGFECPLELADP